MHDAIAHASGTPGSVTPATAASMPVAHQNIRHRQVTHSTMAAGTCQTATAANSMAENGTTANGTHENGSHENVAASDGASRNVRHHNISQILDQEKNILDTIVEELLAKRNADHWKKRGLTGATLFKNFLSNAKVINASFTVDELDKIAEIYCRFTRVPAPFKKSDKASKCNMLSALFGDKSCIEVKKENSSPT